MPTYITTCAEAKASAEMIDEDIRVDILPNTQSIKEY
jgi:hypothetical protein